MILGNKLNFTITTSAGYTWSDHQQLFYIECSFIACHFSFGDNKHFLGPLSHLTLWHRTSTSCSRKSPDNLSCSRFHWQPWRCRSVCQCTVRDRNKSRNDKYVSIVCTYKVPNFGKLFYQSCHVGNNVYFPAWF